MRDEASSILSKAKSLSEKEKRLPDLGFNAASVLQKCTDLKEHAEVLRGQLVEGRGACIFHVDA